MTTKVAVMWRALTVVVVAVIGSSAVHSGATPTPTPIAQVPLTVAVTTHPQILLAVGNSESMDGSLSGAIMLGSGSLDATMSSLQASSSPVNYPIPAGFTPPLTPGALGSVPYTVSSGGLLVDNSPSRLNVAKAGITAMLNSFIPYADFALLDYQTGHNTLYTTWVYEMSPANSGFVFTSVQASGNRYALNPCYNYTSAGVPGAISSDCLLIDKSGQVSGDVAGSQYVQIAASSDDPLINDVLYDNSGRVDPVCLVYGGPVPTSPYTAYSLSDYNASPGYIRETYAQETAPCGTSETPTNAAFVAFSPQVMYIERGFGYSAWLSATTATTLVPMTTSGSAPTPASVSAAISQFTPFLAPETNSLDTVEIKASSGQSPLPGLLAGAALYYQSAKPTASNGCEAQRYVILVTDGLPTVDLNFRSWPPPGTTSAVQWGMTVGINADGSLNPSATKDQAVLDTISQLAKLRSAHIKTYVIGLGAGVDPTVNPVAAQVLTAMAIAGGTGNYVAATSPDSLTRDLQGILSNILAVTQSTTSTAVNSMGLHVGSVSYVSQFTTADTFQDWTGNLSAYPIDPTTGQIATSPAVALWSARDRLDAQDYDTGRKIVTWDPIAGRAIPFRWSATPAVTGITPISVLGHVLSGFPADSNGSDMLQYLRGSNALEQRSGGQFRNRTHKLGDIVSSAALYVGAPSGFSQSPDYFAFIAAKADRSPTLYVGANDGMLHAFDAATGTERFAYIPAGVFQDLPRLANPYYNESHRFFVNGSPRAADVKFGSDSSWHTVLVSGEGAGGHSLFALDVTNPDTLTSETAVSQAVLWEFFDPDMGLSFSEPAFAATSLGWAVLAGNGYNSFHQKPVLYALNPQSGAILAKVDLCAAQPTACDTSLANGLSNVTVVNSFGQVSAAADTVYAGDLQGNVWRVDISKDDPTQWVVTVIYQARDPSGAVQPITTTPAVALNAQFPRLLGTMVFVGTGELLGLGDLSTTQTQSLYGIFDPPTGSAPPLGFNGIPTRSDLIQQTLANDKAGGVSVRTVPTVNAVNLPGNRGWYVDLTLASRERIVTDPEVEAGGAVVLTTYQPNSDACVGGGNSWLMVFNATNGAGFPLPELDVNGDGRLDNGDVATSGMNPIGMSLGPVYASMPTLLPGKRGTSKLTTVSSDQVSSVLDRGTTKRRIAWWEVRH